MMSTVSFVLDGRIRSVEISDGGKISPTTTLLEYLRALPDHKGVKEGCAEGDCGACTVVIAEPGEDGRMRYTAVDSCIVFLPSVHRKWIITVENLRGPDGRVHPVQQQMVRHHGSQCGFCTPGIIMSMFAFFKSGQHPDREAIARALEGNLCRCTGYRTIIEATAEACTGNTPDNFSAMESSVRDLLGTLPECTMEIATSSTRYLRPASLQEAVSLLHAHPDAVVIGGGTDIALRVTKAHEKLGFCIDISGLHDLKQIAEVEGGIRIGGGVALTDVMNNVAGRYPALYEMCRVYGSTQIRNVATLGGNLATASPIGDSLPVLMAYRARVILEGLDGRREIPVEQFVTGYRATVRRSTELITAVIIPKPDEHEQVRFYKISRRRNLDISTLSAAMNIRLDPSGNVMSSILAYGGMANRACRAVMTEQYLAGKPWNRQTVVQACHVLASEFTPITDVRGSADFRTVAAGNLLLKFWTDIRISAEMENDGRRR